MRIPISWLEEYVDVNLPPEEVAEIITLAGMEVGTVERIGVKGADLEWPEDKVFWAQILDVARHPDAEKLVLATVDYGADAPKVVVTGAPNLYPLLDTGGEQIAEMKLFAALILEGATYLDPYKNGRPTKLKGKKLRGVYNDSMLCSPVELGLGDDHDGIILLPAAEAPKQAAPGTPLRDVLGDVVLDVDIIPNIARCASMVGIAREFAALTGSALRMPPPISDDGDGGHDGHDGHVRMEGPPIAGKVEISSENPALNPRFVAMVIEGVEQRPAPFWMQHRLRLAGQRPINVVVDISNYVMLELGQPNHTFDYDILRQRRASYGDAAQADGPVRIITRMARDGETLTTLDGVERKLYDNNILVTDPAGNLSIGGIMGGANSEIQPESKNVLLEAAAWNFINIRHTGRQLALQTDAGFRFSRGVHPSMALYGAKRAAELLRTLAGGTVAQGIVDYYPNPAPDHVVDLDPNYVRRLSGLALEAAEIRQLLERLAFRIEDGPDGTLRVTTPDHRMDIEGPHDLVEEVCRMYGYDRIPIKVLSDSLPPQRGNPSFECEEHIKDILVQQGLQEVISYRLTTAEAESKARVVNPAAEPALGTRPKNSDADNDASDALSDNASDDASDNASASDRDDAYIRLANPSTLDRSVMRRDLLASVLEIAAANSRFQDRLAFFEIGQVYLPRVEKNGVMDGKTDSEEMASNALPDEIPQLAIVLGGMRGAAFWQDDQPPAFDFYDLKGLLQNLAFELKVDLSYQAHEHPSFRPGRCARLVIGQGKKAEQVGVMGELHPLVADRYGIALEGESVVLASVIDLDVLVPRVPVSFQVQPVPTHPAVREDLAFVVDADTRAVDIEDAIRRAGGPLLRAVELFDVYSGSHLGAGKKSLAYHLTFQAADKTLKGKDTAKVRNKIIKQLANIGAALRE